MKVHKRNVWSVVALAFPEYAGRKFGLLASGHVTLHDLHWGGGARSEYVAVALDESGRANRLQPGAPWFCPAEGAEIEIPPGWAVVEHSYFCGRDCGITIHVRPESVIARLTA